MLEGIARSCHGVAVELGRRRSNTSNSPFSNTIQVKQHGFLAVKAKNRYGAKAKLKLKVSLKKSILNVDQICMWSAVNVDIHIPKIHFEYQWIHLDLPTAMLEWQWREDVQGTLLHQPHRPSVRIPILRHEAP
jgi:hypothetical protein